MRKNLIPLLLAALTAMYTLPSGAIDPGDLNRITFNNNTGQDIRYIFLSPSDSSYWGTDILGSTRVLQDDEELAFFIHYPDRCNEFDIYAIGDSEEAFLVYNYEICDDKEAKVRLTRHNLDEAAPSFSFTTVTLENASDYDLWYIFFSPGDSNMWGVDQLDEETILSPGGSVSLLLPVGDETLRYDVHAVDEDADTYTFYVEIDPALEDHVYEIENGDLDLK